MAQAREGFYLYLHPRGHHYRPEGQTVWTYRGEQDTWHPRVDHGGARCYSVGCAACGGGDDQTWGGGREIIVVDFL